MFLTTRKQVASPPTQRRTTTRARRRRRVSRPQAALLGMMCIFAGMSLSTTAAMAPTTFTPETIAAVSEPALLEQGLAGIATGLLAAGFVGIGFAVRITPPRTTNTSAARKRPTSAPRSNAAATAHPVSVG